MYAKLCGKAGPLDLPAATARRLGGDLYAFTWSNMPFELKTGVLKRVDLHIFDDGPPILSTKLNPMHVPCGSDLTVEWRIEIAAAPAQRRRRK